MKTRAWDGKQWRTDFLVDNEGRVYKINMEGVVDTLSEEDVDWKLSRFTDHVDINKDEIYEGHIVELASGSIGIVEFKDGSFIVDVKKESGVFEFYEWPSEYFTKYNYDDGFVPGALILGDIFTTPELLEV